MNMNEIQISGRTQVLHNGKSILDFRPFFGGNPDGDSCCGSAEWQIRGMVKRNESEHGTSVTIFTGGCCAGYLIEAWIRPDGSLIMGNLFRLPSVPHIVIPLYFDVGAGAIGGQFQTQASYLAVTRESVTFTSWYHEGGAAKLLMETEKSLLGDRDGSGRHIVGRATPKTILDRYPQILDEVEKIMGGKKGKLSKEEVARWADSKANYMDASWCS